MKKSTLPIPATFRITTFVASAAVACLGLSPALAQAQTRLTMGGTHSSSAFYSYQVAVVSDWNNALKGKARMTIQELGGAAASTEALLRGEVDMGISVTSTDFSAVRGEASFKTPSKTLRTLYFFAPLPLNWAVAADSGINSLAAIGDRQFSPGGRGTATEGQTEAVLKAIGLKLQLSRGGASDALEAYQNRRIVGFVKAGLHPDGYLQQAHASRPVRLLQLSEEQAKQVVTAYPYFSVAKVQNGKHYGDQPATSVTVQTAIGINTSTNLSADIAYEIVKRAFSAEGIAAATSGYAPAAQSNAIELTLAAAVAPLHAGVVRYLKEQKIEVPKRLIPPEYKD
jgi:TRAP transporter TAXI family solute receptor